MWCRLYETLIARHGITGIAAFSPASLAAQLAVPGMVAVRADCEGQTVGMVLWYRSGDVAYYHLGAYDARGYALRASYAIFATSMRVLAEQGVRWLSLGAGAGVRTDADDGLTRFKRGWATGTRTAYLCGRILDRPAYTTLCRARAVSPGTYFPGYRSGEFT